MEFNVGDLVTIRPSQQLYWKVKFCPSDGSFPDTFRAINYVILEVKKFDDVTSPCIRLKEHYGESPCEDYFNVRWFDWDLEGNPDEDFASKSENFKTLMNNYPHCKWCHTPIMRHYGGEFHNHWEHIESYIFTWTKDGYKSTGNKWACKTNTCDGKWHIAEHPFLGVKDGLLDTKPPKLMKPILFYNGNQQLKNSSYDTIIQVNRTEEIPFEVIETKKGRRFKNF